ncbi:MAG: methyltransferase domain-containing protein [Acutalibacteraceae bacterium]
MEQQAVIDFLTAAAADWDAQLVRNEAVIGKILDNAGLRPGVSVLDVACGTGVLIPDYLERGAAQVTAIDIAPEMARIAREKFPQENVTVLCGDAARTRFETPFDCIMIYNAFPHFPEPERLICASGRAAHARRNADGGARVFAQGARRAPCEDSAQRLQRSAAGRGAGRAVCKASDRHGADLQR